MAILIFTPALWAEGRALSVTGAVSAALNNDPGIESSNWDWLASEASAEVARDKMLPSIALSAGYLKLSALPASSIAVDKTGNVIVDTIDQKVATMLDDLFPSLTNSTSFKASVQYPIFAGFRVIEAARIAKLQAQSKGLAIEIVKRALAFEVRRAYWEASRADHGVETLKQSLDMAKAYSRQIADRVSQGLATNADQLTAGLHVSQAELSLTDALAGQRHAYFVLASLMGDKAAGETLSISLDSSASLPYTLSTEPGTSQNPLPGTQSEDNPEALIATALSRRPEIRISGIAADAASHSAKIARGGLYPTVTLVGDYLYADPNPRVIPVTDEFTGTWDVGIVVGFDLGGIPGSLAQGKSADDLARKAGAEEQKQSDAIILDVRTCLLAVERTRRDLELAQGMVAQAEENLRATKQKYDSGLVNEYDVLGANVALLQSRYGVTSRLIDEQIAFADLSRALAVDEL
jgi:outer membrane protein TolC